MSQGGVFFFLRFFNLHIFGNICAKGYDGIRENNGRADINISIDLKFEEILQQTRRYLAGTLISPATVLCIPI